MDILYKEPEEVIQFKMNFASLLRNHSVISAVNSISVTPDDGSLIVNNTSNDNASVFITISGGNIDTDYTIIVSISANGNTFVGRGKLKIRFL